MHVRARVCVRVCVCVCDFKLLGRQGVSKNMAQYRSIAVNVAAFQWNVREAVTINIRTLRARIGVLRVPPSPSVSFGGRALLVNVC